MFCFIYKLLIFNKIQHLQGFKNLGGLFSAFEG
jgi:hypothetical protein